MKSHLAACCSLILLATTACGSSADDTAADADMVAAEESPIAATDPAPIAEPTAEPTTAPPSPRAGYDWALRIDESDRTRPAILAYERSGTDDQPLNFSCEEGGARIFAGITGGAPDLSAITVASGEQALRLVGVTRQTEMADMPRFTSREIPGDSPFLASFATNGWLRLTAAGPTTDMAATPAGTRAIASFIEHCNRPYSPTE
ncbi:hypothetical protein GRI97_10660 [Altererythrobacter xixiisoli]|uniref:Uncharacterized protein n=1 Tax=Croceibacterium xixiisoli TaxID=1476466 RepID=A0A6I4TW23_9SPHN|nr:hypothetical protein [Croceibacterium xixiisoli]MXO99450.1 hypothetical protein [Croceibacterium xixiisoli]